MLFREEEKGLVDGLELIPGADVEVWAAGDVDDYGIDGCPFVTAGVIVGHGG